MGDCSDSDSDDGRAAVQQAAVACVDFTEPPAAYSPKPIHFVRNLYRLMHRSTMFAVSAAQMVAEGEHERGDICLSDLPALRAAPKGRRWRAQLVRCSNWRAMQVLPQLLWFDVDGAGIAIIDFGAWDTAFLLGGGMGVLELAHLVRRYTAPSPSNTEQSFRHKLNAWGMRIDRVPRAPAGVHMMQLARTDSICDFRFERCNWQVRGCRCCLLVRAFAHALSAQTFPWARCRRGTKQPKLPVCGSTVHKRARVEE